MLLRKISFSPQSWPVVCVCVYGWVELIGIWKPLSSFTKKRRKKPDDPNLMTPLTESLLPQLSLSKKGRGREIVHIIAQI